LRQIELLDEIFGGATFSLPEMRVLFEVAQEHYWKILILDGPIYGERVKFSYLFYLDLNLLRRQPHMQPP
jgi:hypothetical protein